MRIKYIGTRAFYSESVTGLKTEWSEESEQDLADDVAAKLLKFPTMWVKVEAPVASVGKLEDDASDATLSDAPDLEAMSDAAVREFARARDIKVVDLRKRGDALRQAVREAMGVW